MTPIQIVWIYDRDSARHPFIQIGAETLRRCGFKVLLIDGADKPHAEERDRISPFSRLKMNMRYESVCAYIDKKAKGAPPRGLLKFFSRLMRLRHDAVDFWITHIKGAAAIFRNESDIVISSRPQSMLFSFISARITGRRFVYYPFELYGEQAAQASRFIITVERVILQLGVDMLITQNTERAHVYHRRGHKGPVSIVPNYKPRRNSTAMAPDDHGDLRTMIGVSPETRIALYAGVLGPGRWLDDLAQAALLLPEKRVMVFMGPQKDWWRSHEAEFTTAAVAAGKLFILPPVPEASVIKWALGADLGIAIYSDEVLNNIYAAPGKLSDYVFAGLPIVAPALPTIEPLIRDLKIGICFHDPGPEEMAIAINKVLDRPKKDWAPALKEASPALAWELNETRFIKSVIGATP